MDRTERVAFLTLPGLDHFVADIVASLRGRFQARAFLIETGEALQEAVAWADILWFEFCWPPFPHILNQLAPIAKKKVVRLHAVEAIHTDHVNAVAWETVSALIVVSDGMRRIVRERAPGIAERTALVTLYNGVNLDRFRVSERQDMSQIAWVGNVIEKKNPLLALHILRHLRRQGHGHRLHIAGRPNLLMQMSLTGYRQRQGLDDAVLFHGQVQDMPTFLADKGILLSTSLHESFGYAIAEGMAVGAFPVVADYPGAREFWPEECLFDSIEDAAALILRAEPGRYVAAVRDRLSLQHQLAAIERLLTALPVAHRYRQADVGADGSEPPA